MEGWGCYQELPIWVEVAPGFVLLSLWVIKKSSGGFRKTQKEPAFCQVDVSVMKSGLAQICATSTLPRFCHHAVELNMVLSTCLPWGHVQNVVKGSLSSSTVQISLATQALHHIGMEVFFRYKSVISSMNTTLLQ